MMQEYMDKVLRYLKEVYPRMEYKTAAPSYFNTNHWFVYADTLYLEFYNYPITTGSCLNSNWIYINGNRDRCGELVHCIIEVATGKYIMMDSSLNPKDQEIFEKIRYLGVSNAESFIHQI